MKDKKCRISKIKDPIIILAIVTESLRRANVHEIIINEYISESCQGNYVYFMEETKKILEKYGIEIL